jgi:hypothetical protein
MEHKGPYRLLDRVHGATGLMLFPSRLNSRTGSRFSIGSKIAGGGDGAWMVFGVARALLRIPPTFCLFVASRPAVVTVGLKKARRRISLAFLLLQAALCSACYGAPSVPCRASTSVGNGRPIGGMLRFSTTGHPGALRACYVSCWQLPRLDPHQLPDDDLQRTPLRSVGQSPVPPPVQNRT